MPFNESQTRREPNEHYAAPMMHCTGEFNYFDGDTFQVLEIPYRNKEISMIVFLPKAMDGLTAFEQSMTPANMDHWLGQLQATPQVAVSLPKFKTSATFELDTTLRLMGMQQAFHPFLADFSGMTSKHDIFPGSLGRILWSRDLFISVGSNVAIVNVNEQGTIAMEATTITVEPPTIIPRLEPSPAVFRVDHPFVLVIRDNRSSTILFMGRVTNP